MNKVTEIHTCTAEEKHALKDAFTSAAVSSLGTRGQMTVWDVKGLLYSDEPD